MRDVTEVPFNAFDVLEPRGKDPGKLVASRECAVHEHCTGSEVFFFAPKSRARVSTTSKVDSVKRITTKHQAVCELLRYDILHWSEWQGHCRSILSELRNGGDATWVHQSTL